MTVDASFGARSEVGLVRDQNEDSWLVDTDAGAYVIADGMGGHAAGEVASRIAVEHIGDALARLAASGGSPSLEEARDALSEAIVEAGERILRQARENPEQAGMGTTAVALFLLSSDSCLLGHVGDSRAYQYRDGKLRQVTRDHSLYPGSPILTRALGTEEETAPDVYRPETRPGDVFLLATDGLTDMVSDEAIREVLHETLGPREEGDPPGGGEPADPERAADALIEAALQAGGHDNVTAVVVRIGKGD